MDKSKILKMPVSEEPPFQEFNLEEYLRTPNKAEEASLRKTAEDAAQNDNQRVESEKYEKSVEEAQKEADIRHIEMRSENTERLWCGITDFILGLLKKGQWIVLVSLVILLILYAFDLNGAKNLEEAIKSVFNVFTNGAGGAILTYFAMKNKSP